MVGPHKEGDQLQFWDLIREGRVKYVHFAPPCGTASRAREIRRKGCDPKPLRSDEEPDGLPHLTGMQNLKKWGGGTLNHKQWKSPPQNK